MMKSSRACLPGLLALVLAGPAQGAEEAQAQRDWAHTAAYQADNLRRGPPASGEVRVVFMGDSITEAWPEMSPGLFASKSHIGRGISGQTTPQMLVRFRPDVIALKPAVVLILAGTNDIAGNTGPTTLAMIESNIASMAQLARANGIRVVLASVLPASRYYWNEALRPAAPIAALNELLKALARREGYTWLDFHSAMVDQDGGLPKKYSDDGVHPSRAGYALMRPLAEQALRQALAPP